MKKIYRILVLLVLLTGLSPVSAQDARDQADLAVANILFDYEYSSEFATYKVGEDGFVDIIFAENTPDDLYVEIIDRLDQHPHIKGVLSSKSGPSCKISNWQY